MQKKIIALAVAGALAAPAMALAEASVYGQANVSIDMVKDGAKTNSLSANQLNSNKSRVGVKGSEDLGGGNSLVWQMEGTVAVDTGAGNSVDSTGGSATGFSFDRDTYVGLKNNDIGTLILGNHDLPYKIATRDLDVFADTIADNRSLMGGIGSNGGGLDARVPNVIAYMSPNFSGFSVAAASVFGAETPQAAPADKKGTAYSISAMYSMDQIYASLSLLSVKFGDANTGDLASNGAIGSTFTAAVDDKLSSTKVGVGYAMDPFTVNFILEKPKYTPTGGTSADSTNMYLSGTFKAGDAGKVKLAYTKAGETKSSGVGAKDGATQVALGYDHSMSKNTTLYALYTKVSNDTNGSLGPNAAGLDSDPSAISFGVKHAF